MCSPLAVAFLCSSFYSQPCSVSLWVPGPDPQTAAVSSVSSTLQLVLSLKTGTFSFPSTSLFSLTYFSCNFLLQLLPGVGNIPLRLEKLLQGYHGMVPWLLTLHFCPGDGDLDSWHKLLLVLGRAAEPTAPGTWSLVKGITKASQQSANVTVSSLSPHFLIWAIYGNEDFWQTANGVKVEVRI